MDDALWIDTSSIRRLILIVGYILLRIRDLSLINWFTGNNLSCVPKISLSSEVLWTDHFYSRPNKNINFKHNAKILKGTGYSDGNKQVLKCIIHNINWILWNKNQSDFLTDCKLGKNVTDVYIQIVWRRIKIGEPVQSMYLLYNRWNIGDQGQIFEVGNLLEQRIKLIN